MYNNKMIQQRSVYKLKEIVSYPFEAQQEKNKLHLSYTVLANKRTLQSLNIQLQAYRQLFNGKEKCWVLFFYDESLNKQQHNFVIYASYNVMKKLNNQDEVEVLQLKSGFEIIQLKQYLLPNFPIAEEIMIQSSHIDHNTISKLVSQGPFIIQQKSHFIVEVENLQKYLYGIWKSQLTLKRKIQRKSNRIRYYINIFLRNKNSSISLFNPGQTKISFFNPLVAVNPTYHTRITISPIQAQIFELKTYQNFKQKLSKHVLQSKILNLHYEHGTGITSFLQLYCQQIGQQMLIIDCNEFSSVKQLYYILQHFCSSGYKIAFVKNMHWIKQLITNLSSQGSNSMKMCFKKLQQIFQTAIRKVFNKITLIIGYQNTSEEDGFNNAFNLEFLLNAEDKKEAISIVMKSLFPEQTPQNNDLFMKTSMSLGWSRLQRTLDLFKCKQELTKQKYPELKQKKSVMDLLLDDIHSQTKLQKVQNVANVSWDDIGGLQTAKEQIILTIMLPSQHPQIFDDKIKPRTGLLFYGPPGTGKTMLGKCIANQCKMGFISVKGPQLLNMYIGQSEKNLREVFQRAFKSRPCIVFMDQLDALVPKRGNSSDSNQVMDRIVAELMMQMDTASQNGVFIIGATNRPDLLDPSVLRAGRFDKQIYLGISTNDEQRIKILQAQTRKINLQENFNFQKIVKALPSNLTGADFYGLTSKAIMNSMERIVSQNEQRLEAGTIAIDDIIISIKEADFLQAAKTVVPSVSQSQLKHYESLKEKYS